MSPWNYFYKTMVLILSQFLNIKTMVLYFGGSINRESPVPLCKKQRKLLITYFGISFPMIGQNLDVYLGRVMVCRKNSFVYASACEANTTIYLLELVLVREKHTRWDFQLICSPSRNVCCTCKRLELVLKSPHNIMTAKRFWKVESQLLANLWYIKRTKRHFNSISHLSAYFHYATEKLCMIVLEFFSKVSILCTWNLFTSCWSLSQQTEKNVQENEVHYNQVKH